MYILTCDNYDGKKETSKALLARAIDIYNMDVGIAMDKSGAELVETIVTSENGKPSIPGWMEFSISDSEGYWAILIADVPCGFDIQLTRPCKLDRIALKYFADEDNMLIVEEGESAFWRIWARREAAIKAVGATVLNRIPAVGGKTVELNGQEFFLYDVEPLGVPENCYGAMCLPVEAGEIHYFRM